MWSRDDGEVVLSIREGNGKNNLSSVLMGRKRKGNFGYIFVKGNRKEMGRNLKHSMWEGKAMKY